MQQNNSKLYGGLVWIFSGLALLLYGYLGLTRTNIPGVEEFIAFVQGAEGIYIYVAAFVAIFLEGLYVIGSFFPGSSFVLLAAIVAQAGGTSQFLGVILTIYVGWICAGLVNIFGARLFSRTIFDDARAKAELKDTVELTWFPAFRANTEVAQISEGHPRARVFWSSVRVKTYTCLGLVVYALAIPLFIDITQIQNDEGFVGLAVIALISFAVGAFKLYEHRNGPVAERPDRPDQTDLTTKDSEAL